MTTLPTSLLNASPSQPLLRQKSTASYPSSIQFGSVKGSNDAFRSTKADQAPWVIAGQKLATILSQNTPEGTPLRNAIRQTLLGSQLMDQDDQLIQMLSNLQAAQNHPPEKQQEVRKVIKQTLDAVIAAWIPCSVESIQRLFKPSNGMLDKHFPNEKIQTTPLNGAALIAYEQLTGMDYNTLEAYHLIGLNPLLVSPERAYAEVQTRLKEPNLSFNQNANLNIALKRLTPSVPSSVEVIEKTPPVSPSVKNLSPSQVRQTTVENLVKILNSKDPQDETTKLYLMTTLPMGEKTSVPHVASIIQGLRDYDDLPIILYTVVALQTKVEGVTAEKVKQIFSWKRNAESPAAQQLRYENIASSPTTDKILQAYAKLTGLDRNTLLGYHLASRSPFYKSVEEVKALIKQGLQDATVDVFTRKLYSFANGYFSKAAAISAGLQARAQKKALNSQEVPNNSKRQEFPPVSPFHQTQELNRENLPFTSIVASSRPYGERKPLEDLFGSQKFEIKNVTVQPKSGLFRQAWNGIKNTVSTVLNYFTSRPSAPVQTPPQEDDENDPNAKVWDAGGAFGAKDES